jgi:hypothetical protein
MPSSICLSFVFNHQYEKNISKLKKIYKERFSTIRFLSPFSDWNKDDDIIPIYETSIHFQGYFAQAYSHLPKDFDYYVFCADDLILNPQLNEENLIEKLNCNRSGYIKYLNPIWEHSFAWHKFAECLSFPDEKNPIPTQQFLPQREELLEIYRTHGLEYRNLGLHNFWGIHDKTLSLERITSGLKFMFRNGLKRYVHFPLIEGYSDLIVIPRDNLKLFCHFCGVFAALNLWVDAAIATSMVLSCENITQERDHGLTGKEFWNPIDANKVISKAEGKIEKISDLFSEEISYIHPIKLSEFS